MKPKTKLEYKVVAANGQLQPIGQEPVDWAFKHCVEHMAFRTPSGMTTCMDCGHQWRNDTNNKHCRCPHCHTTLEIKDTLRRNYKEKILKFRIWNSSRLSILSKCSQSLVILNNLDG